jgi:hypothetical protein
MLKNILSAVAGYIAIALTLFITFTAAYLILGVEGSFKPGSYEVSTIWIVLSIIISFLAAMLGGYVAYLIAKNVQAVYILAGIVFVLGLIMAIGALAMDPVTPAVREGAVDNFEAMQKAVTPIFIQFLNPFIGTAGVLLGGRKRKSNPSVAAQVH